MEYDIKEFGSCLYTNNNLKQSLSKSSYKKYCSALNHEKPLDLQTANEIAQGMKGWAINKGCTHYTHWFHPLTGSTAEKHNSFIEEENGKAIFAFSGKSLIKDESDASSFPSGGLRATFEARGYTYWDIESPAFVRGHVLYIPTVFVSYTGESLDTKKPLLQSIEAVSKAASRVVNKFSKNKVKRVLPDLGLEQEYFLVDKQLFLQRRDLYLTGKTLLGALPPKNQELEKHYYGPIPHKVNNFMEDVNKQLWDLGIYAKAEHNEVAPGQFELSPTFTGQNISIDQNMIMMDILQATALKHDLVCLLHEKPYAGVNGSGKHNNYSLTTDLGDNLFDPGKEPEKNIRFLLITSALIKAVNESAELIRLSASDAGNDFRLGASEAPPAIISIYLGETIENVFKSIGEGKKINLKPEIKYVSQTIGNLPKDNSDRNRTSPIAFTGNKFEFRLLGSSLNASGLNIVINTSLAKQLDEIADELDKEKTVEAINKKALEIIANIYSNNKKILFSGNGYSDEWIKEAKKRGLSNIPTFVEAIEHFANKKAINLFEKYNVYSCKEIIARSEIMYESYFNVRSIEAKTMIAMIYQNIIPSAIKELNFITACPKEYISKASKTKAKKLMAFIDKCSSLAGKCEDEINKANKLDTNKEKGLYILEVVLPICNELRMVADKMEHYISKTNQPYPIYEDLFFNIEY